MLVEEGPVEQAPLGGHGRCRPRQAQMTASHRHFVDRSTLHHMVTSYIVQY